MLSISRSVIFVFVLIFVYTKVSEAKNQCQVKENPYWQGKKLKMVHLLFRHGARTPVFTYPNDIYVNETYFPYGLGQLTNIGKNNLYEMGIWLKKRYGRFLGEYYKPNIIWAQSTGVPRTIMSLQTVLTGMYPPRGTPMNWNVDLNWQPIPTFAQPPNNDTLLLVYPCPRYDQALQEVIESRQYQKVVDKYKPILNKLSNLTGLDVNQPLVVLPLYSTLLSESQYGLRLPKWTEKYFPSLLIPPTLQGYKYYAYSEEQKLLKGGPFIKTLIEDWTQKRNGTLYPKDRRLFAYCGHDLSVISVLSALNIWNEKTMPVTGIMIIFELLLDIKTRVYGVQIYLRVNAERGPEPLTLPGCDHFCPLNKFIRLTKRIVPKNIYGFCHATNGSTVTNPNIIELNNSFQNFANYFPRNSN